MADIIKFQRDLLTKPEERKKFAANPKAYLDAAGIAVPPNVQLPATLPLDQLEHNVKEVEEQMSQDRLDTAKLGAASPAEFARFVGDAVPLKTRDIANVVAARTKLVSPGGDVATAAAVAVAVVAAVVAVPVAVFGRSQDLSQFARPELGITGVTAGRIGITLHGPAGLRAEGLSAEDVANVIRNLR